MCRLKASTKLRASNFILTTTTQWLFQSWMGVASGFDGAPDGFGRAVRALLPSAVVPVPLTSKTLFQADGQLENVSIQGAECAHKVREMFSPP